MEKYEVLTLVSLKFCSGCVHSAAVSVSTNAIEACVNNDCPYKKTYLELKRHLEKIKEESEKCG